MRTTIRFVWTAVIFALATWLAPWPVVAAVSALLLLVMPRAFSPVMLACAAAAAWAGILGWTWLYAPLGTLAAEVGGIFHVPGGVLVALSVVIAFGLAWGGAEVALVVRARDARREASARPREVPTAAGS
ncbi:MAG TPA: hypothetical protein VLD17_13760 [Gemmatimonadaceae bacterium]|jgi:hypothetical protein|nr:hypothetical protein [Gemmatimonadaceae bacterium]